MKIHSLGPNTCDILVSLTVLFIKPDVIFTVKVLPKVYHICFYTSETYIIKTYKLMQSVRHAFQRTFPLYLNNVWL